MKEYGLIVVGTGAGMNVVDSALERGLKVAIVEEGPVGGTCLNRGCIPSKVLVHVADVIREAEEAAKIGVSLKVESVDYKRIKELASLRLWLWRHGYLNRHLNGCLRLSLLLCGSFLCLICHFVTSSCSRVHA